MTLNDNGSLINITAQPIKSGGEGSIYVNPNNNSEVIKVYHVPQDISYESKLNRLTVLSSSFVKPKKVFTEKNKVVGFSMDFVDFNKYFLFNKLFNKSFCSQNNLDYRFKFKVLNQIKSELLEFHNLNIIVGDLNQYNIFFNLNAEILFVDVDSYQDENNVISDVVLEDIQDFSAKKLSKLTDYWAFGILSFWSLTYVHPLKYVVKGEVQNLKDRALKGLSYLSSLNMTIPPLYQKLPQNIEDQFKEIFKGRRFLIDFSGTTPVTMFAPKQDIDFLKFKDINVRELTEAYKINYCGDSLAVQHKYGDWSIYKCNAKGYPMRVKQGIIANELYVSENNWVTVNQSVLTSSSGTTIRALYPNSNHFHNGHLFCLGNDEVFVYYINMQMMGKVDSKRTIVYSKSISIKDSVMQYFGKKTSVIDLVDGNMVLYDVVPTIKNAININGYMCIEYVENNKIVYAMFKKNGLKLDKLFYLDSLVTFTTTKNIICVPQNGEIHIYMDSNLIEKLEVPMCTTSSILHMTSSGIIMFENNIIYVLNKK